MKRSYQNLSMEIKKLKSGFVIKVEDKDKDNKRCYKEIFKCDLNATREQKLNLYNDAGNWLWNMGYYNGQANPFLDKNYDDFISALEINK